MKVASGKTFPRESELEFAICVEKRTVRCCNCWSLAQSQTLPGLVSVNFLMNIGGEADLNEFDDIAQPCSSSFTELFMEKEKMRVSLRLQVP